MGLIDVALLLVLIVAVFILGIVIGFLLGVFGIWLAARAVGADADLYDAIAYSVRVIAVGPVIDDTIEPDEEEEHNEDDADYTTE